ncbi:MAG TPA: hypothetical protein VFS32_08405 [Candidatus Limnocylindrales bacterium]|nr:hypothetical protein [Candidatus Limnocylindrales bacterium]
MTLARDQHRLGPAVSVAVAVVAALAALLAPPAVSGVTAATPDLTIVTAARYDVRPADHLVRVRVDATAVNHRSDTTIRRYYYDSATIAVLPGTRNFHVSASGAKPHVSVAKSTKRYVLLRVAFGKRVYSHRTFRFHLTFDLPDRGGAATRDVRIGQSLVSFPVWAFATASTPGSSVTVRFPSGYDLHVDQGSMTGPTKEGDLLVLRRSSIGDAAAFFAYLSADRPGSYRETAATSTVGDATVPLAIRSWTDDPAWGKRVGRLFVRALPATGDLVGVAYPRSDQLVVQESVTRSSGGYAGLFDPSTGRIEVAYYASPFVVLHEAAHAWFNGALLVDRWADEAFASYYAELAAARLHVDVSPPRLTKSLEKARIPLNAWQEVGRDPAQTESYAYAASLELARAIGKRAGTDGLARVWAAAAARQAADQPVHPAPGSAAEPASGPPDWRSLLDLLETRTDRSYDDLWRTWVVRPDETALLDERAAARSTYADAVAAAGDWELPPSIRRALDAWQFDTATALLGQAREVLDRRTALADGAASAGVTLPGTVERDFEGAASLRVALDEAETEIAAMNAIGAAAATRPVEADLVTQLGLLSASPESTMDEARTAFSQGRLTDAVAGAESARATWIAAPEAGRQLALRIALGLVVALLLVALAVRALVRRRGRRSAAAATAAPSSAGSSDLT